MHSAEGYTLDETNIANRKNMRDNSFCRQEYLGLNSKQQLCQFILQSSVHWVKQILLTGKIFDTFNAADKVDQDLIQSNPTSHPQNQKGKKHTHICIGSRKTRIVN